MNFKENNFPIKPESLWFEGGLATGEASGDGGTTLVQFEIINRITKERVLLEGTFEGAIIPLAHDPSDYPCVAGIDKHGIVIFDEENAGRWGELRPSIKFRANG